MDKLVFATHCTVCKNSYTDHVFESRTCDMQTRHTIKACNDTVDCALGDDNTFMSFIMKSKETCKHKLSYPQATQTPAVPLGFVNLGARLERRH